MESQHTLKIMVHDGEDTEVEVVLPMKLARWALKLFPIVESKIAESEEMDIHALQELLNEGLGELEAMGPFDLVKIRDGETNVRISIE